MAQRHRVPCLLVLLAGSILALAPQVAGAWGRGHGWIRVWAVGRLPARQTEAFGPERLAALTTKYLGIQDAYAGGKHPELAPYCTVPDVRVSLHDVNPPEATFHAVQWYLEQVCRNWQAGQHDEAMKYLGVLCHWCEDPGSLSAHSSPVDEATLRQLIPPPASLENHNYLYGAGWIGLEKNVGLDDLAYRPQLLGGTIREAAALITREQRAVQRHAAGLIVPALLGRLEDDPKRLDAAIGATLNRTARFVADVLYTAGCLAQGSVDPGEAQSLSRQQLTRWIAEPVRTRASQPYYVVSHLVGQSLDARRALHPLQLPGAQGPEPVAFGWGMGTPCRLEYALALGGVYKRFTARVGLHPTAGPKGKVVFSVKLDGRPTGCVTLAAGQMPAPLAVSLPEQPVIRLTLEAKAEAGSEPSDNLAVWAEPWLLR
ncbi:MAG: NPCBM/NEW2 domain-containing protein [Thermoguttaceae bacterium]